MATSTHRAIVIGATFAWAIFAVARPTFIRGANVIGATSSGGRGLTHGAGVAKLTFTPKETKMWPGPSIVAFPTLDT